MSDLEEHDEGRVYQPGELIYAEGKLEVGDETFHCFYITPRNHWEHNHYSVDWTPRCALFDDERWAEEMEGCVTYVGPVEEARKSLEDAGFTRDVEFEKFCKEGER